jgi:adenine-specific DNA-methyltransferase
LELVDDPSAVVLDSFAGSGTTAHAVLAQNAKDGGNRKFILVEGEDYADTLTAERVRRVINGYEFAGTQREELLRENITWSAFSRDNARQKLLDHVQSIENLDGPRFDRIKKTVKDGELIVTGEKDVTERTDGLGGTFTYCTLGPAIELDALLTGESLPAFDALGSVLFHMATNAPFDAAQLDMHGDGIGLLGSAAGMSVWLIYKPELDWLKSKDAALTLERAKQFAAIDPHARHLVFAPARFVSQKLLDSEGLKVEFAPLPYALYRIERA